MPNGEGLKLVPSAEVRSKRSLHVCRESLNGQTKRNGDGVDERLKSVVSFYGSIETRSRTGPELELLLAKGYVDSAGVESVKVDTNPLGHVLGTGSGKRMW